MRGFREEGGGGKVTEARIISSLDTEKRTDPHEHTYVWQPGRRNAFCAMAHGSIPS